MENALEHSRIKKGLMPLVRFYFRKAVKRIGLQAFRTEVYSFANGNIVKGICIEDTIPPIFAQWLLQGGFQNQSKKGAGNGI